MNIFAQGIRGFLDGAHRKEVSTAEELIPLVRWAKSDGLECITEDDFIYIQKLFADFLRDTGMPLRHVLGLRAWVDEPLPLAAQLPAEVVANAAFRARFFWKALSGRTLAPKPHDGVIITVRPITHLRVKFSQKRNRWGYSMKASVGLQA